MCLNIKSKNDAKKVKNDPIGTKKEYFSKWTIKVYNRSKSQKCHKNTR